jgi:hypothetical protein
MTRRTRLSLVVLLAAVLVVLVVSTGSSTTTSGWSLQATFRTLTLSSLTCRSSLSCTAAGFEAATPLDGLGRAVAAVSTPTGWAVQRVPVPPGATASALNSVACGGTTCRAVGAYIEPGPGRVLIRSLAVLSNGGGRWVHLRHPAPDTGRRFPSSTLILISCASHRFCVTAGHTGALESTYYPVVLVYHGQAGRWRHVPLFPGKVFQARSMRYGGLSCASAFHCMVVGTYTPPGPPHTIAFSARYAQGWRIVDMSPPAKGVDVTIGGVSCTTPTHCVLVGQYGYPGPLYPFLVMSHPFVRTYTGTWGPVHTLPEPNDATGVVLTDISCPVTGTCTAVGAATVFGVPGRPLAYRLEHGRWTMQSPPVPRINERPYLTSVSCPTTHDCVALGLYDQVSGSFVERLESRG